MSNLELWDSVKKTDPAYTKQAKKGAYQFTSIAPTYQYMKATTAFGIQGVGWGVIPESQEFSEKEYGTTILLNYDAVLFFKYGEESGRIPIHATEKVCYMTQGSNGYLKIDDEARKKVVTNAITKGLSGLGFNADVFMGEFDNSDYLDAVSNEFRIERAEDKLEEQERQNTERKDWIKSVVTLMETSKSENELRGVYKSSVRKANLLKDTIAVKVFTDAKETAKARLEALNETV